MNNERIQYLLSNYISDRITPAEWEELKESMNATADEELYRELSTLWEHYPVDKNLYAKELTEVFRAVEKQTHLQRLRKPVGIFLRIASMLLLPLICTLGTYYYMEKQTQPFVDGKVKVQAENGHRACVTLPDGSVVRLNSGSYLSYPQMFGKEDREVELSGEAFFNVSKEAGKKFIVHTEYIDIEVLGTTFNVYSYEKENTFEMVLLTGQVKINTNRPPYQTIYVKPKEKISFNKKEGQLKVQNTEAHFETAWLRDELIFRSEKLENVFLRLERKYGVSIQKKNFKQDKDLFTGSFWNSELTDVLNILKTHYHFTYKVMGNNIILYGEE